MSKKPTENPMFQPIIEKVTVNISVGKSGEPLEKAVKILKSMVNREPCRRDAKKSVKAFSILRGEAIACMVTLRRVEAEAFLKRAFRAVGNRLYRSNFDRYGNFAFGIKEHLDVPDTKYDPELGVVGMDVCVTLKRRGEHVAKRKIAKSRVGPSHRLTAEEAAEFIKSRFGVEIA